MLEFCLIEPLWLLPFRTDLLTHIFKIFPFFTSNYFYFVIIALGYWKNPSNPLFRSLGFLIPFSILLNCILKNVCQILCILCPLIQEHLMPVHNFFGFPSGDIQVASVFWISIFFSLKRTPLRWLCLLPIGGIAFSSLSLGVHGYYAVLGGFAIGIKTYRVFSELLFDEKVLSRNNFKVFWPLVSAMIGIHFLVSKIGIYFLVSEGITCPPMVPTSIGALIGFGLSLRWIKKQSAIKDQPQTLVDFVTLFGSLMIVIGGTIFFPIVKTNEMLFYICIIVKYSIVLFGVFSIIPPLRRNIVRSGDRL